MNYKKIYNWLTRTLKIVFLASLIILIIFILGYTIYTLINTLNKSIIPISQNPQSDSIFNAVLGNANFSVVFISILFAIMSIIVTIIGIFWIPQMNKMMKMHQDYEKFKRCSPYEANITTAKIFYLQERYNHLSGCLLLASS